MIYRAIESLLEYGIKTGLIEETERIYSRNLLLDLMREDAWEDTEKYESRALHEILGELTDIAVERGIVPDSGENRDIFITLCYTLVPYTIFALLHIFLTNFANAEVGAFLVALRVIGYLWSGMILIVGLYYVHQFSFGGLLLNLLLTVIGVAIILFLLLLGYSLLQQIITFVVTIYNEIVFRL